MSVRRFLSNHKVLSTILTSATVLVAADLLWNVSAAPRGHFAAWRDVSKGKYLILGYGLPGLGRQRYVQLMHDRYGVEYKAVAGCIVSRALIAYVDAYDDYSTAAIEQKFGPDLIRKTAEDAERQAALERESRLQTLPAEIVPIEGHHEH